MASQRRWKSLPHSLKNKKYHTPEILRRALEREPLHKRDMQAKNIQWLGQKLSPHLLLGLNDENETDAQDREWENVEKNNGFYPPWEKSHTSSLGNQGVFKALKEMQEED